MEAEGEKRKKRSAAGRTFRPYRCDFSDRRAVYGMIAKVKAECPGRYSGQQRGHDSAQTRGRTSTVLGQGRRVNLNAQFVLSREFGRGMVAHRSGEIIFTASLLTFQGGITVPATRPARAARPVDDGAACR